MKKNIVQFLQIFTAIWFLGSASYIIYPFFTAESQNERGFVFLASLPAIFFMGLIFFILLISTVILTIKFKQQISISNNESIKQTGDIPRVIAYIILAIMIIATIFFIGMI